MNQTFLGILCPFPTRYSKTQKDLLPRSCRDLLEHFEKTSKTKLIKVYDRILLQVAMWRITCCKTCSNATVNFVSVLNSHLTFCTNESDWNNWFELIPISEKQKGQNCVSNYVRSTVLGNHINRVVTSNFPQFRIFDLYCSWSYCLTQKRYRFTQVK